MNQVTDTPNPHKERRWPKVLLGVSLVFNLLVIGLVVGANLRDERDARRFAPPDREMTRDMGIPSDSTSPRDK